MHNGVCFHCQQCAEKYLKALLEELGQPVPRTHNLDDVLTLLLPSHGTLRSLKRGLIFLTRFAVDTRYPGEDANTMSSRGTPARVNAFAMPSSVSSASIQILPSCRRACNSVM